jgi:hypothetical protein
MHGTKQEEPVLWVTASPFSQQQQTASAGTQRFSVLQFVFSELAIAGEAAVAETISGAALAAAP